LKELLAKKMQQTETRRRLAKLQPENGLVTSFEKEVVKNGEALL
jgi:hypothetical protein